MGIIFELSAKCCMYFNFVKKVVSDIILFYGIFNWINEVDYKIFFLYCDFA